MFKQWETKLNRPRIFHGRKRVGVRLIGFAIALFSFPLVADPDREAIFEAVWSEIALNYYDADFGGKDWDAIGEQYRERLQGVEDSEAFDALLTGMLRELGESHFSITPPSFNDLMPNAWRGGDSGIGLSIVRGRPIVHRVQPESPAERAGIRPGTELIAVNGDSVSRLYSSIVESGVFKNTVPYYLMKAVENRMFGTPGRKIELSGKMGRLGRPQLYAFELREYRGLMSIPLGNLGEAPIELEKRAMDSNVVYLRFNLWVPSLMEEMRAFLRSIDENAVGLIIDIRGNPGGIGLMATGLAGMLVDEEYRMGTMRLRNGHLNFNVYPQSGAFLGPVAVLIDNSSISTSEIFAADMQETGRGRVFGTRSAGAALPSVFKKLPNRYFLQMAIADYVTRAGTRIERSGVIPDQKVELSAARLRNGSDNVVEAAEKWILRQK